MEAGRRGDQEYGRDGLRQVRRAPRDGGLRERPLQNMLQHQVKDILHQITTAVCCEYKFQLDKTSFVIRRYNFSQLVEARLDTIAKLRASAEYLDSVWLRCRVSKTMGTGTSMIGGGLTIAGGILTTLTAGAAAPVLIAGIATSSVGAATNIGTSLVEKILSSKQIKDMNAAFERDKEITGKLDNQLESVKNYRDSSQSEKLFVFAQQLLKADHIVVTLLKGILVNQDQNNNSDSTNESDSSNDAETQIEKLTPLDKDETEHFTEDLDDSGLGAERLAASGVAGAAVMASSRSSMSLISATKDGVKYSAMDAGVFVESGKVIGSNSFRVAGQVVIGISAAFLVWDAIDLGFAISDLVRKRGSSASRVLREKADLLEEALNQTIDDYNTKIPD